MIMIFGFILYVIMTIFGIWSVYDSLKIRNELRIILKETKQFDYRRDNNRCKIMYYVSFVLTFIPIVIWIYVTYRILISI